MTVGANMLVVHCTHVIQSKISPLINVLSDIVYSDLLLEKKSLYLYKCCVLAHDSRV